MKIQFNVQLTVAEPEGLEPRMFGSAIIVETNEQVDGIAHRATQFGRMVTDTVFRILEDKAPEALPWTRQTGLDDTTSPTLPETPRGAKMKVLNP